MTSRENKGDAFPREMWKQSGVKNCLLLWVVQAGISTAACGALLLLERVSMARLLLALGFALPWLLLWSLLMGPRFLLGALDLLQKRVITACAKRVGTVEIKLHPVQRVRRYDPVLYAGLPFQVEGKERTYFCFNKRELEKVVELHRSAGWKRSLRLTYLERSRLIVSLEMEA